MSTARTPPIEELAGTLLITGFDGTALPHGLGQALAERRRGGAILFRRNVAKHADGRTDVHAVAALDAALVDAAGDRPTLIAVDQEGGRVMRLGPPVLAAPTMRRLGKSADLSLIEESAYLVGRELAGLGISMSFAPVLDVDTNPDNPVIGDRSFGADPRFVGEAGVAYLRGLSRAGVAGCGKHFPGHGDTHLDSHLALPRVHQDRARVDAVELAPFRRAFRESMPAIMTAHVVFDALDPSGPATLSRSIVTDLLRRELGFEGVCMSDDLFMRGVSPSGGADAAEVARAGVAAVEAGCDVLLFANDGAAVDATFRALVERAERDSAFAERLREAHARTERLMRAHPPRPLRDASAIDALFADPAAAAIAARWAALPA